MFILLVRLFFFNDTATTEIYTLSLHDALPICCAALDVVHVGALVGDDQRPLELAHVLGVDPEVGLQRHLDADARDRKSTRLNSSHANISYAVFCLKKKKHTIILPLNTIHTKSY